MEVSNIDSQRRLLGDRLLPRRDPSWSDKVCLNVNRAEWLRKPLNTTLELSLVATLASRRDYCFTSLCVTLEYLPQTLSIILQPHEEAWGVRQVWKGADPPRWFRMGSMTVGIHELLF